MGLESDFPGILSLLESRGYGMNAKYICKAISALIGLERNISKSLGTGSNS